MSEKKVTILSIDGGGIRGIIPGVVMEYIEGELRRIEGDDKRIADYFDLIAGTSTGGILTGLYLIPDESNPTRPKYDASEAVNLYFLNGPKIFDLNLWNRIRTLGGMTDEKYDAAYFEKALKNYFGDSLLSDLLKPSLIAAYDIEKRRAVFFTSIEAKETAVRNFKMRDVVRATSSAPTYFEPPLIYAEDGAAYALIDGGVFANNPALCAYAEARKINFSNIGKAIEPCGEEMLIISLGSGAKSMARKRPYLYRKYKDAGKLKWIPAVIDIMTSGNSETVDYQLMQIFDTMTPSDKNDYHRVDPGIGLANPEMDDASPANMEALRQAAKAYIAENQNELDVIVSKLIAHKQDKKEELA
ncbi:patatin [Cryomorpha ignava]|uniref:Patatin n=1 Tax=Cryomorpha ignava TaxID=101383 RepID=A0A7K3WQE7_9FLAO|nr:patatin-like phospholipase family protein [Cryomorpha ignava]NEN23102.1 patatin [Cryomorpha ignava]